MVLLSNARDTVLWPREVLQQEFLQNACDSYYLSVEINLACLLAR
jgi:hypothetical protein